MVNQPNDREDNGEHPEDVQGDRSYGERDPQDNPNDHQYQRDKNQGMLHTRKSRRL
jgi:hypothetical protein